ncbi:uncharacterized protein LOC144068783 isoform X2 [Stigmatopora argus]
MAKQKDVMNYHQLQEFVYIVTEAVPGLMSPRQRAQLILGLRARLILELCKGSVQGCVDLQMIQNHLERLPVTPENDAEVKKAECTFVALVQSLLKDPSERAYFFQAIFPVEYGEKYDTAIQALLWELLAKLEMLLPVPDLKQTAAWLRSVPQLWDQCVQSRPEELALIFEHCKAARLLKMQHGPSSSIGSCIMSALSIPPSHKPDLSEVAESIYRYGDNLCPVTIAGSEQYSDEAVPNQSDAVEAFEMLTETIERTEDFVAKDTATNCQLSNRELFEEVRDDGREEEATPHATELLFYENQRSSIASMDSSPILCEFKSAVTDQQLNSSAIAKRDSHEDNPNKMTSILFVCSQCPFYQSVDAGLSHFHTQTVLTTDYRKLWNSKNSPTPGEKDEIFTSIKLLPKGDAEKSTTVDDSHEGFRLAAGKQKSLTCQTCGRTFTRTSDVFRHQLTHTGERPFRCSQCDGTFQHSWDLAKHQRKSHGAVVSFTCSACNTSFPHLRALTAHHKCCRSEGGHPPPICFICGRGFDTASELQEHRKSHVAKRYVCPQCGEGFDSLAARSLHRQTHIARQQFKCPHCEKTYTRRSDVKRHVSVHTGERPHMCGQCGRRFLLRFMLARHMRVHTGERPFRCVHCAKSFTLASVLARHERMHTGEKPFLCSQCGKAFLSQGELSKHHRSHVDERPFACPRCDKRFKTKATQQKHLASHAGARPFPCAYCGKGFSKPSALSRHHMIHTGERPWPCGYCDKSFLTLVEARLHQRVHTGERPYSCTVCPRKFKSSSELSWHNRCHSGTKPAEPNCGHCNKIFSSKAKLKKHMETHTEEESAQPPT